MKTDIFLIFLINLNLELIFYLHIFFRYCVPLHLPNKKAKLTKSLSFGSSAIFS
jgi:hypothetical protein